MPICCFIAYRHMYADWGPALSICAAYLEMPEITIQSGASPPVPAHPASPWRQSPIAQGNDPPLRPRQLSGLLSETERPKAVDAAPGEQKTNLGGNAAWMEPQRPS
jgi:hypothetical protein